MASEEIIDFYENQYDESVRLTEGRSHLEYLRTIDVLSRVLPEAPARILDVGGGAGVYAQWLAKQGHDVTLIDPVPRHVAAAASLDAGPGSITASVGDVRHLAVPDDSFDAVLMLGPLYHLTARKDRVAAWAEARDVCRLTGVIVAAVISRFASFHDMLTWNRLSEPGVAAMVKSDVETGQHRNTDQHPTLFTTAYFHHPDDVADEALAGGVQIDHLVGLEGLAGHLPTINEQLAVESTRDAILDLLRTVEEDRTIIGASGHILAIAGGRLRP